MDGRAGQVINLCMGQASTDDFDKLQGQLIDCNTHQITAIHRLTGG